MGINVRILDSINAREVDPGIVLPWSDGVEITLRQLIGERVRLDYEKVAAARDAGLPPLHPLVAWRDRADAPHLFEARVRDAQARALGGYEAGTFFVVVDGQQVEDLDTPFRLRPASVVRFIRLIQLKGG